MKKKFGQDITEKEAEEQRARLVAFFEVLIKIDQKHKKKSL